MATLVTRPAASHTSRAYRRSLSIALPLTLAVPVAYALWFHLWGIGLNWPAVAAGAAGWLLALALRTPIILAAKRMLRTPERGQTWIVAASGPCEEGVRIAALLLLGRAFPIALSIGLGWAAIEVVYSAVNSLGLASLAGRTDEKAVRARQMLEAQGMGAVMSPTAPYWGIAERITASAIHIGFTLLLAWQPLLAIVTIPLHSASNATLLRLARRSLALMEVASAVLGAAVLVAGLLLFGRL